ncbi:MAG: hypothetical protein ACKV2T_12480 [Kofleriaceae bacterium]
MSVTISPTRAAPRDTVRAVITGAPFDLQRIQVSYLIVALQDVASRTAISWISPQKHVVDATTLDFVVPGGPGTAPPIPAGAKRVVFRFGMWQDRAQDLDLVAAPVAPTPTPAPTPAPMPPAAGVHMMQIDPDRAGPGQTVTAILLDGSLDFTRMSAAGFSAWLTVIGTGAAVNFRVVHRVVDARTVQFTVPPLGANGFHAGGYRVVMRYGFWEGRGQRDLAVTTSSTSVSSTPAGPSGMAFAMHPTIGVSLPVSLLGAGWPAPLASSLPGRPAGPSVGSIAPYLTAGATNHFPTPSAVLLPVVAMPTAAMPVFLAATPTPMATPVPAALPAGTTLATLAGVCRGRVRDRISAFFALNATAMHASESVKPIVDGIEITPAIAELVDAATDFLYIAMWGLDSQMRLSVDGQKNVSETKTIAYIVKERAAKSMLMSRPLDVKLLVWRSPLDDEFAVEATDLEALTCCHVPWNEIAAFDPDVLSDVHAFVAHLRAAPYLSSAPEPRLLDILRAYRRRPAIAATTLLLFPTGIDVAVQANPAGMTKSHHQKLVITPQGAYIGGLNFLKDYWDGRDHAVGDTRRDSSSGPASGGMGGSFSSVGQSGMLHDTGSIVRGASIEQAMEMFAMRWDEAVQDGLCNEHIAGKYNDDLLTSVASMFTDQAERKRQQLRQRRVIDGAGRFVGSVDPDHSVEDILVVSSLPSGTAYGPTEDIRTAYYRAIQSMTGPRSFALFETQYFSDRDLGRQLYRQWRNHRGGVRADPRDELPPYPFAYFVIPYNPSTAWPDEVLEPVPFVDSERLEALEGELKILRWLEIQTARRIYMRHSRTGPWKARYEIDHPVGDVSWDHPSLEDSPDKLDVDTVVTFSNAYKLHENGQRAGRAKPFHVEVQNILTDSDIMSFCLVGARTSRTGMGQDFVREFMLSFETYVHSKCALFLNDDDRPCYATIGSANLNPRSLGNAGAQDSELNVWFAGRDRVEALWKNLAGEHTGATDPTPRGFAGQGWENLRRIFMGGTPSGHVVRVDVADRWLFQSTRSLSHTPSP